MKLLNVHTTKIYTLIVTVLSSIIITRALGPAGRGEYSYTYNIIILLITLGNSGFYQRFPYFLKEKKYSLENLVFLSSIHLFFMFIFISGIIFFLQLNFYYFLIFLLIISYITNGLILIKNENSRNIWTIINFTVYISILFYLYMNKNKNIDNYFYALIIKELVFILGSFFILKNEILKGIPNIFTNNALKKYLKYLKFSLPLMLGEILVMLNFKADLFILKNLLDFESIGYYTLALTVSNLTLGILEGFSDKLYSRLHKNSVKKEIFKTLKLNFLLTFFIYITLIFTGKFLITKIYGVGFLYSYKLLLVLFLSNFPAIIFKLYYPITYLKEKHFKVNFILFLGVVFNLFLNYILVPKFGIIATCYISIISYSFIGLGVSYKTKNPKL
ncbi:MAG: lipopolysaccharide biosynthesis protein [Fusobacteriaceae bacterium]